MRQRGGLPGGGHNDKDGAMRVVSSSASRMLSLTKRQQLMTVPLACALLLFYSCVLLISPLSMRSSLFSGVNNNNRPHSGRSSSSWSLISVESGTSITSTTTLATGAVATATASSSSACNDSIGDGERRLEKNVLQSSRYYQQNSNLGSDPEPSQQQQQQQQQSQQSSQPQRYKHAPLFYAAATGTTRTTSSTTTTMSVHSMIAQTPAINGARIGNIDSSASSSSSNNNNKHNCRDTGSHVSTKTMKVLPVEMLLLRVATTVVAPTSTLPPTEQEEDKATRTSCATVLASVATPMAPFSVVDKVMEGNSQEEDEDQEKNCRPPISVPSGPTTPDAQAQQQQHRHRHGQQHPQQPPLPPRTRLLYPSLSSSSRSPSQAQPRPQQPLNSSQSTNKINNGVQQDENVDRLIIQALKGDTTTTPLLDNNDTRQEQQYEQDSSTVTTKQPSSDLHLPRLITLPDNHHPQSSPSLKDQHAKSPPPTRYLMFAPYAGITNQIISIWHATMIAKQLDRVLLIPNLSPNVHVEQDSLIREGKGNHDQDSPQLSKEKNINKRSVQKKWSEFIDLDYFSQMTGVEVQELDTFLDTREQQQLSSFSSPSSSSLPQQKCFSEAGYGGHKRIDITARAFFKRYQISKLRNALPTPFRDPKVDNSTLLNRWRMDKVIDRYHRKEFMDQEILCLNHVYHLLPVASTRTGKGSAWYEVGKWWKVNDQVEKHVDLILGKVFADYYYHHHPRNIEEQELQQQQIGQGTGDQEKSLESQLVPSSSVPMVPFVGLHLRRGDFHRHCLGIASPTDLKEWNKCYPSTDHLIDIVSAIQPRTFSSSSSISTTTTPRLPVLVLTNERDPIELAKSDQQGWIRVDHGALGTLEKFGNFGPILIDGAILARAKILVGVRYSTYFKTAAWRAETWRQASTIYVE